MSTYRQRLALHLGRIQNQRQPVLWDGKGGMVIGKVDAKRKREQVPVAQRLSYSHF